MDIYGDEPGISVETDAVGSSLYFPDILEMTSTRIIING